MHLALLLVLAAGCAYIPQKVNLTPDVAVTHDNIGQGKEVIVQIVDDRDDPTIGHRANAYGNAAAITTEQDVTEIVKQAIVQGLKAKGFKPVNYADIEADLSNLAEGEKHVVLRTELRTLKYDTEMGLWTGGNVGKAVVKAVVTNQEKNNERRIYERSYQGQDEIRTAFVGSQETNAKVINGALGMSLSKLFEDSELLKALKK